MFAQKVMEFVCHTQKNNIMSHPPILCSNSSLYSWKLQPPNRDQYFPLILMSHTPSFSIKYRKKLIKIIKI